MTGNDNHDSDNENDEGFYTDISALFINLYSHKFNMEDNFYFTVKNEQFPNFDTINSSIPIKKNNAAIGRETQINDRLIACTYIISKSYFVKNFALPKIFFEIEGKYFLLIPGENLKNELIKIWERNTMGFKIFSNLRNCLTSFLTDFNTMLQTNEFYDTMFRPYIIEFITGITRVSDKLVNAY